MISAVVLAHNDEKTLPRTLASLAWCEELVVVDDHSTDKSPEIATKAGAKVFSHGVAADFAKQRNFGLAKARGEWVLFVDSDEVVTPKLAREIGERVKEAEYRGYFLKRRDFFLGKWLKHGETGKVRLLRLAKKDAGRWQRPVHETWEIQGPVRELTSPLLHFPHPNVAQFLEEINYYSSLNARYLYGQKIKVPWWQIIVYPKAKFLLNYFWRLGFLDGTTGIVMALMMSFHSFLTRAKLWLLWQQSR